MHNDPIVEEMRAAGKEMFRKCGNDIDRFGDWLREQEKLLPPERFVDFSAKCSQKRMKKHA